MAELSIVEAINDAFHVELARDDDVLVMGEDVGRAGGVFRATAGLRDRFGADRCVDTPLAEAGILGTAIGLCMAGWRPVCEMQYDAFSYPGLDQLINHVGRYRWRTGGKMEFPLVVRMPYGGGVRAPELHDDSPETYYVHTPGVKVAIPSTPADAKGLIAAAIRDPDPVVVLEPKLHYRTIRGEVPEGEHVVPLGKARIAREGSDVSLVAYGSMVPLCEQAADALEGEASVEVLDIRTLKPLDEEALLASAAKTGTGGARTGGATHAGLRGGARRDPRGEGDPRPPRAGASRHRLRRSLSVLADRGRVHAVGRARARRRSQAACVLSEGSASGSSAASPVTTFATLRAASLFAGRTPACASCRLQASRIAPRPCPTRRSTPGGASRSWPSPRTSTIPTRSRSGTRSARCSSATCRVRSRPALEGDEQAVSLWRVDGGLRVLIVAADAWIGRPR